MAWVSCRVVSSLHIGHKGHFSAIQMSNTIDDSTINIILVILLLLMPYCTLHHWNAAGDRKSIFLLQKCEFYKSMYPFRTVSLFTCKGITKIAAQFWAHEFFFIPRDRDHSGIWQYKHSQYYKSSSEVPSWCKVKKMKSDFAKREVLKSSFEFTNKSTTFSKIISRLCIIKFKKKFLDILWLQKQGFNCTAYWRGEQPPHRASPQLLNLSTSGPWHPEKWRTPLAKKNPYKSPTRSNNGTPWPPKNCKCFFSQKVCIKSQRTISIWPTALPL